MTADPAALLRLATDIEALEGPDREMDARVWCALHPGFERRDGAWVRESGKRWQKASAYTASVDAALGLLADALPGYGLKLLAIPPSDSAVVAEATVFSPNRCKPSVSSIARAIPRAIVAAVLRAASLEGPGNR